jgi:DNA-binding NtrC family response regulator
MGQVTERVASETLIVGDSLPIRRLRSLIARVGPTSAPILIQGPTGSGKELVAQALHARSLRGGRFVAFNVCAIAETMFEDALFGHTRGAFTGATSDAMGYLAEADRGTAFFDEIGGLPLAAQAKLLRVIETGEFRPVGASRNRRSDFRVVAATNEDIARLVALGKFRADLAARLNGFIFHVPPLAARTEDVPLLARFFLDALGVGEERLTGDAMDALADHDWPGNVRELKHVLSRACILAEGGLINRRSVELALEQQAPPTYATLRGKRQRKLLEVLDQTGWDVGAAAQLLGTHRATIYRRLKQLGIDGRDAGPRSVRGVREVAVTRELRA